MLNGTRICELSECRQPFRPKRSWQICCCPNHGTRLRYLRRRDRLARVRGGCQVCHGRNGGVAGNENIVDGVVMCDYCHAEYNRQKAMEILRGV